MAETADTLEGRVLAHRKILAAIVAHDPALMDALREIAELGLHEEDPGAVPGDGISIEGALADEGRRLLDLARGLRDARGKA